MLYYMVDGGVFCRGSDDRKCYGSVVTSPAMNITFGSLIVGWGLQILEEVQQPLPPLPSEARYKKIVQVLQDQEYLAFLTDFKKITQWVLSTGANHRINHRPEACQYLNRDSASPVLKRAIDLLNAECFHGMRIHDLQ
ncbi:hypothetical protein BDP27DRAFT_1418999 [Rhodocollybia butyracea]|uniref:Uncharacterized protein n=1 Tax=Rhodocollybia butyracea TaxID=206335 RepID=A0A9P5Q0J9_9AGAR|nr:hypothetical protein BDP27DRAFT_1418999 [Rhodocollybia butyracea]